MRILALRRWSKHVSWNSQRFEPAIPSIVSREGLRDARIEHRASALIDIVRETMRIGIVRNALVVASVVDDALERAEAKLGQRRPAWPKGLLQVHLKLVLIRRLDVRCGDVVRAGRQTIDERLLRPDLLQSGRRLRRRITPGVTVVTVPHGDGASGTVVDT